MGWDTQTGSSSLGKTPWFLSLSVCVSVRESRVSVCLVSLFFFFPFYTLRPASQTTWQRTNHGGVVPCHWCVTGGRWIRSLPEIRPPPSTSCHFERLSTQRSCRVRPTGTDRNRAPADKRDAQCLLHLPSALRWSASDTLVQPALIMPPSLQVICARLQLRQERVSVSTVNRQPPQPPQAIICRQPPTLPRPYICS